MILQVPILEYFQETTRLLDSLQYANRPINLEFMHLEVCLMALLLFAPPFSESLVRAQPQQYLQLSYSH